MVTDTSVTSWTRQHTSLVLTVQDEHSPMCFWVLSPARPGSPSARALDADSISAESGPDASTSASDNVLGVQLLRQLPEDRYRLRRPLLLVLHRTHDYYWVAPERFVLHGVGATPQEAVSDYACALLDYFEDLRRDRAILAPHLTEHLEYMESLIVEE